MLLRTVPPVVTIQIGENSETRRDGTAQEHAWLQISLTTYPVWVCINKCKVTAPATSLPAHFRFDDHVAGMG